MGKHWYEIIYQGDRDKFDWYARIECAYGSLAHYVKLATKDLMLDHLPWRKQDRKLVWQVREDGEWLKGHKIKVKQLYGNIKDYKE